MQEALSEAEAHFTLVMLKIAHSFSSLMKSDWANGKLPLLSLFFRRKDSFIASRVVQF